MTYKERILAARKTFKRPYVQRPTSSAKQASCSWPCHRTAAIRSADAPRLLLQIPLRSAGTTAERCSIAIEFILKEGSHDVTSRTALETPRARSLSTSLQAALALFLLVPLSNRINARETNLVTNPDFARTYKAQRTAPAKLKYIRSQHRILPAYDGEPFMPYGWIIIPNKDGAGRLNVAQDGDLTALRVRTGNGETLRLIQRYVEVVPDAQYDFSVQVKGIGDVHLSGLASNPAPAETVGAVSIRASKNDWKTLKFSKRIGWHRHLAELTIRVSPGADVLVRAASVAADAHASSPLEITMTVKAKKDADTLFFEDFDSPDVSVKPGEGAGLTAPDEGRFGRGMRTTDQGGGSTARMQFGALPKRGTIEFWFKPAKLPESTRDYLMPLVLTTQTPGRRDTQIQFTLHHWLGVVPFGFRKERYKVDRTDCQRDTGWGWWQPGMWHHFAGSWDGDVTRVYVDGVLGGVGYGKDREGNPVVQPNGQAMDLVLKAGGVIDEIRISRGLRYGPIVPAGATYTPYQTTARKGKEKAKPIQTTSTVSEKEIARLRAANVQPVPAAEAAYVFEAGEAQPSWQDMPGLALRKDFFGKGADGIEFSQFALGRALYWKTDRVEPGRYYLGLWAETSDKRYRTEFSPSKLMATAFLNGYPVRFSTTSDPVQVKPGLWVSELQSRKAVEIKPGDEIAVTGATMWNNRKIYLRLALYRDEPRRGHGFTGQTFGVRLRTVQRLRLVVSPRISGSGGDGDVHEATILIANPLGYDADAIVTWQLADFFGTPLVTKEERVRIPAHKTHTIGHTFTAQGDAQAYQLDVRTRPAPEFQFPVARPREMLELIDWSRMEFMPNQNDPLTVWNHARMDLKSVRTGNRKFVCLDGSDWKRGPLVGRRVPARVPDDIKYRRFTVPFTRTYIKLPKGVFGMWYRKTFRVPDWMRGQNVVVHVTQAICEGTIFVNGQRVGYGVGGNLPFSADVTKALDWDGENELVICVRNAISLVSPDYVDQFDPANSRVVEENQDIYGSPRNAACLNSVFLRSAPPVRVKQALVLPDVEKKTVRVMARLENRSGRAHTVRADFRIMQEGTESSAAIPSRTLTVPDGSVVEIEASGPAGDLRAYVPRNPVLAKLTLTLSAEGETLDSFAQRFGYRSFRVDGLVFNLNGNPVKLLGGFQHFPHNYYEGDDGITVSRDDRGGHALLDEIGKLHYKWVGLGWAQRWKKIRNTRFWDSIRKNAVESVWEFGSHPCIIGWGISNESYHYAQFISGGEGQKKHGELIHTIAQTIRDRFKYPIWCIADGDEDLGGRLDFTSFHYLNQSLSFNWYLRSDSQGYFTDGHSHYPPDCFYLNKASQIPKHGTVLKMRPDWKFGESACGDTETFWMSTKRNGVYMCAYLGDRAAISPGWQFGTGRGVAWSKMSMEGYRDMEQAIISGMYWQSSLGLGAQAVTFALPEQEIRYYAGNRFDKRLNIHDDEIAPGTLTFNWRLMDTAGRTVHNEKITAQSGTTTLLRKRIAFDVPNVRERTVFTLALELQKNGHRRAYEEHLVDVWPRPGAAENPVAISVFDPSGKAAAKLARIGCRVSRLTALKKATLADVRRLVIGPDTFTADMKEEKEALREFVRRGGRAVVLHQNSPGFLPVDTYVKKRARFSMGFVRAKSHPIMKGLTDRDFQMWNPGHLIVTGVYRKPKRGNFLSLVDCGYEGTLAWTPLFEVFFGEGSIVAVQLPLLAKLDTEPMCIELLTRIVRYLAMPVYRTAASKLAVLDGAHDGLLQRLKDIRADFAITTELGLIDRVALLDMASEGLDKRTAGLQEWVKQGGTLILHRARPGHEPILEKLLESKVAIRVQPWQSSDDRALLERRDGLTEGMNHLDFYWRRQVSGETVHSTWQVSNGVAKPRGQVQFLVTAEGATDYLFPGGLQEKPVGKGRIIVDQLLWEMDGTGLVCGSPERFISMLLTNLGIRQEPPARKPSLPERVTYVPIDLSGLANRSFSDAASGDNTGWLDWGPGADLSTFPTGRVRFQGVPFEVPKGKRNAIVLRVRPQWVKPLGKFPESVNIPVNLANVQGLYFLHTGGWAYGLSPFGKREIIYADGTKEETILSGANMSDWNPGHEQFPDEEYTTTTVAWTGANKQYPIIRVYKTLWVNPHPGKTIKSIVITNSGLDAKQWRFIPHFGLTAAVSPEAQAKVVQSRPVESAKHLKAALELVKQKKPTEAIARLTEAINADPKNTAAWLTLAQLRAKTANEQQYRDLCHRWMKADPDNFQPHNALGRYLEAKGHLTQALSVYRKSIKLEWNQPFITKAIVRLEKQLNERKE